ncbi:MAG TPA: NAD-glutamate dehydrogenase [Casimicrobiaceae bacterium]|jgi:glutamate dehydrogenase|nr:NAD-glutamate dehydrogenase [Casimicrobiaceae bacterium]
MANDQDSRVQGLEEILKLVRAKVAPEKRSLLERFVQQYFSQLDPEDLAERQPADLYGAALSHWNFARKRDPGSVRLRVFNPSIEEHGWQSTHTIIEIANDDMPFLVDSVTMEVNRHGLTLHLIMHPIIAVKRSGDGTLVDLAADDDKDARHESFIRVEVDRIIEPARLDALATDLARVLDDVRMAVADWKAMRDRLLAILADTEKRPPPLPADELSEGKAFLAWLADDHFTFLGYRCHELVVQNGEDALKIIAGSSLGILREGEDKDVATSFSALPPDVKAYARRPELLVVTKSTSRSTVHRPGYLDYIAVKRFDARGEVCGEDRFLGLFTSAAYSAKPSDIPLLRRKTANVVARAGLVPGSHADKSLINILENYPRDELFQITEDDLLHTAMGILHLGERQRFRLFVRRDPFERFLSCLIYAPRENYTTELRQKWQTILTQAFHGSSSEFNVHLSESALARVLITVRTTPGSIPSFDVRELEAGLATVARRWTDDLKQALIEAVGEARGNDLARQFGAAFPAAYREDFTARAAVPDIQMVAKLSEAGPLGMSLYRPLEAAPGTLRFKLYHLGAPVTLSDSLPMLEHMGLKVLDERPYRVTPEGSPPIWMHDLGMQSGVADTEVEIDALHSVFEEAFGRVFVGEVENDDFNRLVLAARLPAQEIVVLRAYAKYLRQIGFPLSQAFIEATLAAHADVARALVELFKVRFDPNDTAGAGAKTADKVREIEAALEQVENLSEDRVLRQYLAMILATTRTNFWRRDATGVRKSFVSFKFDPAKVPGLPEPKPMFEIFVYSPRFEGVHLRGGKVARGGLRWSDRPEDFRTEVLGLVKAQMVKNTVIVPVGSKGGFVLKRAPPPSDREGYMKEGIACYQDYLRGLLDITDNRVGEKIVPPPQVKRHDPDDPYLVVAADKGTATFSDYANGISKEYGFWLGDAFASGGSAGYDHKVMGITARGAWESVKRHFREMGVDTQTTDFTVAGIGDMSGDVFGNGMLLSRHIKLVAAFDHRHIFLDPNPDTEASFDERERMFKLPRSSWADYNAKLISAGGGIHSRSAKSIAITPQVKAALGIAADALAPIELVNAILKARVDLLYNGGIGTYVKARGESHAAVGDRANDALRVNGRELKCKVFAEGGNLGCTQLGRIEYALAGGRINTDAIDNSAGVDTSDHEVNIKILLGLAITEGELTEKQRNTLLAEMTDDVAALVLRDNYFQTQALSVTGRIAPQLLDAQQRFIHYLEKAGKLNRALEYLPSDEEIAERRAKSMGLTSPERAVMLAYSKIWLYDELLASTLPDDAWVETALARYFPKALRERYATYMSRHPLKREIIATHVTNSMINRVGSTFVHRLLETTGGKPHEIVRAYLLNREIFGFVTLWQQIEALDNKVDDAVQSAMLIDTARLIDRGTTWFLRSRRLGEDMAATITHFAARVEALATRLRELLDEADRARIEAAVAHYVAQGVSRDLAERVVTFDTLYATLDIVEVADSTRRPVEIVAEIYFDLATRLGLPWLREMIVALPGQAHWQMLAKGAMLDDLSGLQRTITGEVIAGGRDIAAPDGLIAAWQDRNRRGIERAAQLLGELRTAAPVDAAMLSVALRELRSLG